MNSQRASSATSILLTDGRAVKSKLSSVFMVGNRAAFSRRSAARFSRSEQLELAELQQVGEVVGVVGRGLGGDLLGLGADRRQPQRLQVVAQQHQGLGLEAASWSCSFLGEHCRRRVRSGGSMATDLRCGCPSRLNSPTGRSVRWERMSAIASALVAPIASAALDRAGRARRGWRAP